MKTKLTGRWRRRNRRGFTLMEILLVLAILVILGALVGVSYNTIRKNSLIDTAKTQISNLEAAVNVYLIDVGQYPGESGLQSLLSPPSDAPPGRWRGPYLQGVTQLPQDPWGNDYQYVVSDDDYGQDQFEIYSWGPDGQEGTEDDVRIIR